MGTLTLVLPPKEILFEFGELTQPIIEMILSLKIESRNLAQVRDVLLPQLLSGELEIPAELLEA